jgi:hypothetical protein
MKDYTEEQFRSSRPCDDALELVQFCLESLFMDKEHKLQDDITKRLTFEELIGALLKAEDELKLVRYYEDYEDDTEPDT